MLFAADVPPDPDSGAAGTELRTVEALRALGHEVDEIWADALPRRFAHGNLHYLLELPRTYRRVIGRRCAERDYDVVHVNQGHCFAAAREHRRRRRPGVFVCRSHGLDDHMEKTLRPWRERLGIEAPPSARRQLQRALATALHRHDRLAYRWADGVLVSSSIDRDYLVDTMGVDAECVGTVAQAPAASFVAQPAPAMDAARLRRVLHVGGFAYWKGVHAVAAAFGELAELADPPEMTWLCRAEEQARVRELLPEAARDRVRILSWVPQAELAELFDEHGIFLCPSLFEGFAKVFLEAMARGMCVVGTHAGGMHDIIEDGRSGMLVDHHAPGQIAARVRSLMGDPRAAHTLAERAAAAAREYSWARLAREVVAFYERLEARKERAGG